MDICGWIQLVAVGRKYGWSVGYGWNLVVSIIFVTFAA